MIFLTEENKRAQFIECENVEAVGTQTVFSHAQQQKQEKKKRIAMRCKSLDSEVHELKCDKKVCVGMVDE